MYHHHMMSEEQMNFIAEHPVGYLVASILSFITLMGTIVLIGLLPHIAHAIGALAQHMGPGFVFIPMAIILVVGLIMVARYAAAEEAKAERNA